MLLAVSLLGGQIATMKVLVEKDEQDLDEVVRFDIIGSMDPEFPEFDLDALDARKEDEDRPVKVHAAKQELGRIDITKDKRTEENQKKIEQVHPLKDKIADLSSSNPLSVKCFGTSAYVSHSNGAKTSFDIQGTIVEELIDQRDFSDELKSPESIAARVWLAREHALIAKGGQTHLSALGNYLFSAQRALKDAHQFYGDDGLEWAKTLLQTKADRHIQQQIKMIIPTKRYTRKINQKMQLLLEHPNDFIPCTARAERDFGSSISAQLPKQDF